jgi:hypothetical protein
VQASGLGEAHPKSITIITGLYNDPPGDGHKKLPKFDSTQVSDVLQGGCYYIVHTKHTANTLENSKADEMSVRKKRNCVNDKQAEDQVH